MRAPRWHALSRVQGELCGAAMALNTCDEGELCETPQNISRDRRSPLAWDLDACRDTAWPWASSLCGTGRPVGACTQVCVSISQHSQVWETKLEGCELQRPLLVLALLLQPRPFQG